MVEKCANPACSARFLYLHQGKLFHRTPVSEAEVIEEDSHPALYERFWLCDECCKKMTLMWCGTELKLVPLPAESVEQPTISTKAVVRGKIRRHAAAAGAGKE